MIANKKMGLGGVLRWETEGAHRLSTWWLLKPLLLGGRRSVVRDQRYQVLIRFVNEKTGDAPVNPPRISKPTRHFFLGEPLKGFHSDQRVVLDVSAAPGSATVVVFYDV